MNQSELSSAVAEYTNLNKVEAAHAVEAMLSAIALELAIGGEVKLHGFGHFTAAVSPARNGRHPNTGAKIEFPARVRARFKEGKGLKETLNKPMRLTGALRRA